MNVAIADRAHPGTTPALRTLVVCDLVDSTALVERIGDARAAALFRRHDRGARDLIAKHRGHEIDKTDGFLLLFERPVEALAFALHYQRYLRELSREENIELRARVGVHIGEVVTYENPAEDVSRGAKRFEVEGLVKPVAARLMGLALPGQVLVSGTLYSLAQRQNAELAATFPSATWKFHGRYAFKGVPEAMPVHELGEAGVSPLLRPVSTDKAWRARSRWLRPRVLLAELAVLVAVAAATVFVTTRPQAAIAFAERDWVVVGDLRNLTGEAVFDESLEVAFRLSVEQSRHVNVVPDLQVRDTLARMARPVETAVDREIGSEIALREGARAVVLPTIAEVGGRVRVSVEIVDPHSQTTVYSEYADGTGIESVLGSVDRVARGMRERLGEQVRQLEVDSAPLPKVATAELEALRLYALALKADAQSRYPDALMLYGNALEIDPGFALAIMGIARVHWNTGERDTARRVAAEAIARRDRLRRRDQMYLDAWAQNLENPALAIPKWDVMSKVYPDQFGAFYNAALLRWQYENDFEGANRALAGADSPHYAFLPSVHFLRGTLRHGLGDTEGALASFRESKSLGVRGTVMTWADTHLSRGEYDEATRVMRGTEASGIGTAESLDRVFDYSLALDRGDASAAEALAAGVADELFESAPRYGVVFAALAATTRPDDGSASRRALLDAFAKRARAFLAGAEGADRLDAAHALGVAAYAHARAGFVEESETLLGELETAVASLEFEQAHRLVRLTRAELMRERGDASGAARLLEREIDGREPYQVRSALARAYDAAGDAESAQAQYEWLAGHRHRAFTEWTVRWTQRGLNIVDARAAAARVAAKKPG